MGEAYGSCAEGRAVLGTRQKKVQRKQFCVILDLLHLLFHRKLERGLIHLLQFIRHGFGFRITLTSL